jgi:transcriptional regulator with AAA-type ATPase domain
MPGDKTTPAATCDRFCRVFKTLLDSFPVRSFEPLDIPGANPNVMDFPEVQYASGLESFDEIVGKIRPYLRHFVNKYTNRMSKHFVSIPKTAMDALCWHTWLGNIRELQNLMERAVLLSPGPRLRVPLTDFVAPPALKDDGQSSALEQVEREMIVRALQESNWVVGGVRGAAARLRLNRTGLAYKMKKFGISRPT